MVTAPTDVGVFFLYNLDKRNDSTPKKEEEVSDGGTDVESADNGLFSKN